MVSLGTVLTVGIVAAIAAGGYAVYRNADKIGGAFSRGVEQNLTNPLGVWADSLWSGITKPTEGTNLSPSTPRPTTTTTLTKEGLTEVPLLTPTGKTQEQVLQESPQLIPTQTTLTRTPDYRPSTVYREGYYYFNFAGAKYDYVAKLTSSLAKEFSQEALSNPYDSFENIKYIGQSNLQPAGLKLFAESQNYL